MAEFKSPDEMPPTTLSTTRSMAEGADTPGRETTGADGEETEGTESVGGSVTVFNAGGVSIGAGAVKVSCVVRTEFPADVPCSTIHCSVALMLCWTASMTEAYGEPTLKTPAVPMAASVFKL